MSENKQILKYCPNFYKIINFNPLQEDALSSKNLMRPLTNTLMIILLEPKCKKKLLKLELKVLAKMF